MKQLTFPPMTAQVVADLQTIVGANNLSTAEADRQAHARDVSNHEAHLAEIVVWPTTAAQVAAVLRLANERRVPVTPWGAGTSAEGNPIPLYGGILLSLARMDQLLHIYANDFQATVQAGLKYRELNRRLEPHHLFFPVDPGGDATIGGILANNAAGAKTVKYGAGKDNVLAMQVALADGRLIEVGSRSIKQSSGYDLLHLFVGSEGTLGIITEATLKLTPLPKLMSAVVASFPSVEAAVQTVVAVKGSGLEPGALEFIDETTAKLLNRAAGLSLDENVTLFMEFHAAQAETLDLGLQLVREMCREMGALTFQATTDPTERRKLWYARHNAYTIVVENYPDQRILILDAAVPISHYPALVAQVQQGLQKHNVEGLLLGHAGDGNMHVLVPYTTETYPRAATFNEEMVLRALELGGTATGEHGVGIGKTKFMEREHGPALEVMRSLKQHFDPQGILNPGKIFPPQE